MRINFKFFSNNQGIRKYGRRTYAIGGTRLPKEATCLMNAGAPGLSIHKKTRLLVDTDDLRHLQIAGTSQRLNYRGRMVTFFAAPG